MRVPFSGFTFTDKNTMNDKQFYILILLLSWVSFFSKPSAQAQVAKKLEIKPTDKEPLIYNTNYTFQKENLGEVTWNEIELQSEILQSSTRVEVKLIPDSLRFSEPIDLVGSKTTLQSPSIKTIGSYKKNESSIFNYR